jgi:hypothetical protein
LVAEVVVVRLLKHDRGRVPLRVDAAAAAAA